MKYVDEYRNAEAVKRCADAIRRITTRPWNIMEVCGGQTHAIVRFGLDEILPRGSFDAKNETPQQVVGPPGTGQTAVAELANLADSINQVLLTPDGGWAISASGDISRCKDATIRIWNLRTGKCDKILEGHTDRIESLALSPDGRFLVSGGSDRSVCVWELDWEYEFPGQVEWDARVQIYLQTFLKLHPSDGKSVLRQLKPTWSDEDYQRLLVELSYRGYGWLKPEGVRRELERMAKERG